MIVNLDVPFVDSRVDDLRFVPEVQPIPVLDSLELPLPRWDGHLSLRLLGASHQAVLRLGASQYAETVACVAGDGQPLPRLHKAAAGQWQVRFGCRVLRVGQRELADRCAVWRRRARVHPDVALAGLFPGTDDALTYLDVCSSTVSGPSFAWSTVHCYPQDRRLVLTRTSVAPDSRLERT